MGYDLYSKSGEEFRWTQIFWPRILSLAEKYGWKGKGTVRPADWEKLEWNGNYWTNSGQVVDDEDAAQIAKALEIALPNLPVEKITIPQPEYSTDPNNHLPRISNWDDIPLENFFSGETGKKSVLSFIDFLKKGSFEIR